MQVKLGAFSRNNINIIHLTVLSNIIVKFLLTSRRNKSYCLIPNFERGSLANFKRIKQIKYKNNNPAPFQVGFDYILNK